MLQCRMANVISMLGTWASGYHTASLPTPASNTNDYLMYVSLVTHDKKSEAKHRKAPSHPACKKNGKYEVIDKFACLSSVK